MSAVVTITTTMTEEEPNGWSFQRHDEPGPSGGVTIREGWFHEDPAHDDEWPEVRQTDGYHIVGAMVAQEGGPDGFMGIVKIETFQCQGCLKILAVCIQAIPDTEGGFL